MVSSEVAGDVVIAAPSELLLHAGKAAPWPEQWTGTWIPIEAWARFNQFTITPLAAANPSTIFQISTPRGNMALRTGSRTVSVADVQCWLGFAPQLINDVVCVHWLDAQKNLQVLAGAGSNLALGRVIVIDPGHGGTDGGTSCGAAGCLEKGYALDWALRVAPLLEATGWKVILTRTNDTEISLAERVAIAERGQADLFVSLHFNSAGTNRELSGIETYCLTPSGLPSSIARGYADDMAAVFPNNAFDIENLQLATAVHGELRAATGAEDRGVRRARFMGVLRGQNRPAILIEGGYLSNPNEARKIASAGYRQLLAETLANSLNHLTQQGELRALSRASAAPVQ